MEVRWMTLKEKEAYECRLSFYASVYLFREEEGKWIAWYARWGKEGTRPVKCRDLTRKPCGAKEARKQAERFIERWRNREKIG